MHSFLRPTSFGSTNTPKLQTASSKTKIGNCLHFISRRRYESCAEVPAKTMPPNGEVPITWTLALILSFVSFATQPTVPIDLE